VLCAMNSLYLDFWQNLKEKIIDHLNRYLVADEVEIADRSEEYATLSLQGPKAEALLQEILGPCDLPAQPKQHAMVTLGGAAVCVVRDSHLGETGFDLIIPAASLADSARSLSEAGQSFTAAWVGEHAQDILRVEAGIPRYGIDFSEENLLLEVGLEQAVSFNKGCYLGQEVVERIRSRGHVNRKLCGLLLEGQQPAQAGDPLRANGKEVGHITSSVLSPRLKRPIALGYLNKDFWRPGTELSARGDGTIHATVSALPFPSSS